MQSRTTSTALRALHRTRISSTRTSTSYRCISNLPSSTSTRTRNPFCLSLPHSNKTHTPSRSFSNTSITLSQSTPLGTVADGASGASSSLSTPATLTAPDHLNEEEMKIWEKLNTALEPSKLEVQDISGGCGSMYGIEVLSERFRGLGMLKQQRIVNEVLKEEVKGWHGVQLRTGVPAADGEN